MDEKPIQPDVRCDDPRVPLAAERTLLAWIRTALSMMALGFVVARFGLFLQEISAVRPEQGRVVHGRLADGTLSLWLGAGLIASGVFVNLVAAREHVRFISSLQRGVVPPPRAWSTAVALTVMIAVLGLSMTYYLLAEAV